jgi:uncharacterized protein YdhG (YjbR/CyaY superfamily)
LFDRDFNTPQYFYQKPPFNMKNTASFTTIDDYLNGVSDENRAVLQHLREIIKATAPDAEECISYMMPAFKLKGKALCYFAAFTKHCSFFPAGVIRGFEDELKNYKTAKGTIQFSPQKPLPDDLVRRIVRFRIQENEEMLLLKQKK